MRSCVIKVRLRQRAFGCPVPIGERSKFRYRGSILAD